MDNIPINYGHPKHCQCHLCMTERLGPIGRGPDTGDAAPKKRGHPRFHAILDELGSLHDKKNYDYTSGTRGGPLSNFHRSAEIMRLYPGLDWDSEFGVAMAYMIKQLDAALTLRSQKRESVTGEPIAMRLKDVAIYSVIGMVLVEEEPRADGVDILGEERRSNPPAGEVRAPTTETVSEKVPQMLGRAGSGFTEGRILKR